MTSQKRLTKREKRLLAQVKTEEKLPNYGLSIKQIKPLTVNQNLVFKAYEQDKNLMLHGIAGTGKSFLGVTLALQELFSGLSTKKKLVIVRSIVPTRDIGFLPGTDKEKAEVYSAPYTAICDELFSAPGAYKFLETKGLIEFISTSFIRGTTLNDSIVLVDEMQNCSFHELDSVITRMGKNSKIIFAGDFRQSDFTRDQERAGLKEFMRVIDNMRAFEFIEFEKEDIVRSALVKEYIIQKDKLKLSV